MLIRLLVCGFMAAARLIELGFSRRNLASFPAAREGPWSRATYPAIIVLHSVVIAGTALFGRRSPGRAWLAVLLAVQPLRAWVILTLGQRWNTRAAVPDEMAVATDGPYRYVRHPNYLVVGLELASLPLSFGLPRLAAAATLANAILLAGRIREEEAALFSLPGYSEHFGGRKRFLPYVL